MSRELSYLPMQDDKPAPLGMAPLVDIVLLLICFYLLVTQSFQSQSELAIDLPQMVTPRLQEISPAELTLNLTADGAIDLNGMVVTLENLSASLATEQARALASRQSLNVVVRADRQQDFARLDELLSVCRESGLASVSIRSMQGGGF